MVEKGSVGQGGEVRVVYGEGQGDEGSYGGEREVRFLERERK